MREIKFRAWDKIEKEFIPYDTLRRWWLNTIMEGQGGIEFMQYTGLKDKNGKEIYEGDIIGYPNPMIKKVVAFGEYYFGADEYGVSGNGFYLKYYEDGKAVDTEESIFDYPNADDEVIGNIYENPELLKEVT